MVKLDEWLDDRPAAVLVVEDEVLIRMIVTDALREAGHEVLEAASADEALLVLQTRRDIRLVFSDVRMPGTLDGADLARLLQRDYPSIKVVLASGHLLPESLDLGIPLISKPYFITDVVPQLSAYLTPPKVHDDGDAAGRE